MNEKFIDSILLLTLLEVKNVPSPKGEGAQGG